MFTTRENTILWVRTQRQVKVKEKMCFILGAFHGLTQKLLVCCGSTLWYLVHLALLCHPIVAQGALIHRCSVEKNGVVAQLKKHCCLEKKKQQRNSEKSVISFGTTWFLVSQNRWKRWRAALKSSTVKLLLQGCWHELRPLGPLLCLYRSSFLLQHIWACYIYE